MTAQPESWRDPVKSRKKILVCLIALVVGAAAAGTACKPAADGGAGGSGRRVSRREPRDRARDRGQAAAVPSRRAALLPGELQGDARRRRFAARARHRRRACPRPRISRSSRPRSGRTIRPGRTRSAPWRTVPDRYNELVVALRERNAPNRRVDVVLRAYDEGVAFRYVLPKQEALGEFTLAAENTGFYFTAEARALALNLGRWDTSNEGPYEWIALDDIKPASLIHTPLLVHMEGAGLWAALLEADLTDYAGLYVGGVAGMPNALDEPARRGAEAEGGPAGRRGDAEIDALARPDGRDGPGAVHRAELPGAELERAVRRRRHVLDQAGQGGLGLVVGKHRDRRDVRAGDEHGHDEALHRFRGAPRPRIHARRRRVGADVGGRADRGHPALQAGGRRAGASSPTGRRRAWRPCSGSSGGPSTGTWTRPWPFTRSGARPGSRSTT
ncbi:MAG: glycoside hydrolase family 97 N-terminal domain-containing protein [Candidatus Moduliflexus flocculans]|nr:glycoside hydrolase family 97 N-terminal domain-containing protein [Candidatus Moduliflexus flocculans]